ncbi:DUF58 domain-containing protein [Pendulispora rubella]|uniref:DUF58 domain-containing protein n=1 Tax=Pendulispora rubella TaxID=2741070 RepID=A0ABZ2LMB1_9BACT
MSLLDPAFARELEALRRKLRVRARSGAGGDHLGRRRGGSAEFLEHRPYAPGDDLRRIDWLAFARTGEPVFKLFRAEEDIVVRLVLDASASLDYGTPTKLVTAKRMAASIGYMALAQSERTQVVAANAGDFRMSEPTRGRASLPALLRALDGVDARGGTDLARTIDTVVQRSARPGLLVVLSDFMDPGPFDLAISRAASAGHDVALVQVLAQDEIEPNFEGDLAFEDAETADLVEVTVDARAIEAYLARLNGLLATVRALAKRCRGIYVRTTNVEPTISPVRRFVARGVD